MLHSNGFDQSFATASTSLAITEEISRCDLEALSDMTEQTIRNVNNMYSI